ncbi:ariadne RING finger, putative [Entamoeba invadens IP1]|uniref:RBR-type E3 ubiquitin transferase n=1 Tax=Entamoeba invadens IP1 TaxID=370355 RepID=A0A0A1U687_ENTIV|nr:ariadne RING finger, putative [Entamoeba invadens IP1]ELP88400.1 ariadne RING finger, putative [Entamoeba invadens IP1]|eukprot:XP_004255171.1 ariadne RING finger, putative [Entamoeba invadens IP1]
MEQNYPPMDYETLITKDKEGMKKMVREYIREKRAYFPKKDKQLECGICFSESDQSFFYTNPFCGHSFCIPCLSDHVRTKINDANTIIKCPQGGCTSEIPYNDLVDFGLVTDPALLQKYDATLTRLSLDNDTNTVYCIKCGTAMIGEPSTTMVRCVKCDYCFCCRCKEQWHADSTCEKYQQWKKDNAKGSTAFEEYIRNHAKLCPNCHQPIEKNGGCNHMTCKCGYQFCWLCMQKYTSTHFLSNTTGCKQYS